MSGTLVVADNMSRSTMLKLVRVGHSKLVGKTIELKGKIASIQVYEDLSVLIANDPVLRKKQPFSMDLGPGTMGTTFRGIQWPLEHILCNTGVMYVRMPLTSLQRETVCHAVLSRPRAAWISPWWRTRLQTPWPCLLVATASSWLGGEGHRCLPSGPDPRQCDQLPRGILLKHVQTPCCICCTVLLFE